VKSERTAAELPADLGHPVVDNGAHLLEIVPVVEECVGQVGEPQAVDIYRAAVAGTRASAYGKKCLYTLDERRDAWIGQFFDEYVCRSVVRLSGPKPIMAPA